MKKRPKLGLALGAGAARGLAHIGVLKVLHKNNIYPDYLAGTSMGAVIAAAYAAGKTPQELEIIATTADWKNMVDFTPPKVGLLQGKLIEKKILDLVENKKFHQLNIPLQVVAYNLTKKKKALFSKGDVTKAVRASLSMPGIVAPVTIDHKQYVDGMIVDPTPFDIVKNMGAEVVIGVDLYNREEKVERPEVKEKNLAKELKQKFVADELLNLRKYLIPDFWPEMAKKIFRWGFDKLLRPTRILKIMAGREPPEFTKVLYKALTVITNNFARERMEHADIQFKIRPKFDGLGWLDFDKAEKMIAIGEEAMKKELPRLRRMLVF